MNEKLSGIERELVVQYLIDGNVPVTITPLTKQNTNDISLTSNFFPVAVKDNINVKRNGEIILENPPESIKKLENTEVKVEFYFNRVGLTFVSKLESKGEGLVLSIPSEIDRIKDVEEIKNYDFSAELYYEFHSKSSLNFKCVPWRNLNLFTKPVWKDVPLENQKEAKEYLEQFVDEAKKEHNIGYGIQLIPVCNYLTYNSNDASLKALQNRKKNLQILYADHQRMVLGFEYTTYTFSLDDEYGLKLIFSLKEGPISSRDIFVTCKVNKIYKDKDEKYFCVDLVYTNMQEEDFRYLYEKSTNQVFD